MCCEPALPSWDMTVSLRLKNNESTRMWARFLGNLINSMHVSQNMTVILFVSESKNHVEFVKSAHQ
jgi:hypothetical protein